MGAFKFRGAYNALAQLSPEEKRRGVIAFPPATTPRRSPWRENIERKNPDRHACECPR